MTDHTIIKNWIDAVIDYNNWLVENEDFNYSIYLCGFRAEIHMASGIEKVAEKLNVELHETDAITSTTGFTFVEMYFIYRDTKFFQMREVKENG